MLYSVPVVGGASRPMYTKIRCAQNNFKSQRSEIGHVSWRHERCYVLSKRQTCRLVELCGLTATQ
jgi:hypothetical protein